MEGDMAQNPAGRVMEQINRHKQRLEANPKDLEALIALGNANFDIQRFDKAKELYLRALEIDPENVRVRTDLASCYRNTGDLEQALKELDRVLAIDPKHENALYNLGVLLLNDKQDPKGAAAAWEKLIAAHPHATYASDLQKKVDELHRSQAGRGGAEKDKNR
jgi:tetratricopeptide (TPR) repeat protein